MAKGKKTNARRAAARARRGEVTPSGRTGVSQKMMQRLAPRSAGGKGGNG